jgi:outer membrane protein OmpA-like peptidoglycan-associated protein
MKTLKLLPPRYRGLLVAAAATLLAACASTPTEPPPLAQARSAYEKALADPQLSQLAAPELADAREALARAQANWIENEDTEEMASLAYVARQRVAIATAVAERRLAEARVQQASQERDQILAQARARELQATQAQAARAQQQVGVAQSQAEAEAARARQLQVDLQALQAKQSAAGMVVTLSDVLFESGRWTLLPQANQTIDQLAQVLKNNPEQRVTIDGFADAQGSEDFNLQLSQRRAEAVRDDLVRRGVSPQAVMVRAYGEANPVARNDTAEGRAMNRRVEIVFPNNVGLRTGAGSN